ncbi:MAG: SCO family protein [Cytophagaceae bacterium]|nr:SCO family protein [Cytophagaceae bacterium]
MEKSNNKFITVGIVVLVILMGTYAYRKYEKLQQTLPYFVTNPTTNKVYQSNKPDKHVGNFSFTNQQGQTITPKEIGPVIYVADYFFVTCPGICKEMSSQLQRVYSTFEKEPNVKIVSYTSKPEEDSVEALMSYALQYGVKDHNKWIFLTGDKHALYETARKQYAIVDEEGDGGEEDFIHTERFVLVDQEQYIRGYYDGTDSVEVERMMQDIHKLLNH